MRREINSLEEETGRIQKNINSLSNRLGIMQETIYNDECNYNNLQNIVERWRRLTLKGLDDGNFMHKLNLNPASTAEEVVLTLEAATKNNIFEKLRQCLSNISYA